MKALIVVLLISSLPSLAQARQDTCIAADEEDITNTYQVNVNVKEGQELNCMIYYGWDAEKEECVTNRYNSYSYPAQSPYCHPAANIRDSIFCICSYTNCNADLRPFTDSLEALKTKAENGETNLKRISSRQIERQLIACMLEKSKAANGESTTIGGIETSTTDDGGDSMSTSDSPNDTKDTGGSLPSLAQARQDTCIAADEEDITNTYQVNVNVKEGQELNCMIYYGWDAEKEECVTNRYNSYSYPAQSPYCHPAANIRDSIFCICSYTNCNADLRPFTDSLEALKTKAENGETNLKRISSRQIERQLIACMLEKSKAANGESTTIGGGETSTTEDGGDSMSTSDSPNDTKDTGGFISTTPEESTSEQSTLPDTTEGETSPTTEGETTSEPPTTTETNPGESEEQTTATAGFGDVEGTTAKGLGKAKSEDNQGKGGNDGEEGGFPSWGIYAIVGGVVLLVLGSITLVAVKTILFRREQRILEEKRQARAMRKGKKAGRGTVPKNKLTPADEEKGIQNDEKKETVEHGEEGKTGVNQIQEVV